MNNGLLYEVNGLLRWHAQKKGAPIDEWFNRQVHERISGKRLKAPIAEWKFLRLSDEEVRVLEERWSLEMLLAFPKWHEKDHPKRVDLPVIIFRGWSKEALIDGQSRVNFWQRTRNAGPHRTLVVEPKLEVADPFPSR